jgi:hypothetical protein
MEKNSGGNFVIHDLYFGILKIPKSQKNPKKSQIRLFPLAYIQKHFYCYLIILLLVATLVNDFEVDQAVSIEDNHSNTYLNVFIESDDEEGR